MFQPISNMLGVFLTSVELLTPVNVLLLFICAFLMYLIIQKRSQQNRASNAQKTEQSEENGLSPMRRQDMTVEQLRKYNGIDDPRTLMAVNGKVFDVSKGRQFYGPGGPYSIFAGHDASRGLATFQVSADVVSDTYDDLGDLSPDQMRDVQEWELQLRDRYPYVGRLLRPGEMPTDYSDTETEAESLQSEPSVGNITPTVPRSSAAGATNAACNSNVANPSMVNQEEGAPVKEALNTSAASVVPPGDSSCHNDVTTTADAESCKINSGLAGVVNHVGDGDSAASPNPPETCITDNSVGIRKREAIKLENTEQHVN